MHDCKILHDLRMLIRPFGVVCETCKFQAAAETYSEAERIVANHQNLEHQKEELRKRGFLK